MDIRQLTYFIEVAKYKSFTKASKSLHLSQSTLSKVVKSLEEELNVELVDRSAKQIKLTEAGEIILAEGEKIMESLDDISVHLYVLMNLKKGKIRMGIPPVIGFLFFPKIIKEFTELYPEIKIQIFEDDSKTVKQNVMEGSLDIGVAMLPANEKEFNVVPFLSNELSLFVHHTHPLADRDQVDLIELEHETFILIKQKLFHDLIIQQCLHVGFHPEVAFESSEWEFISGMISENLGVSILPKPMETKVDHKLIRSISIVNPKLPWNLGLHSNKKKNPSPAVRAFLKFMEEKLPYEL